VVSGVGAVATQAMVNVGYKAQGLMLLEEGASAQETVDRLLLEDAGRDHRQVGVVDRDGNAASHTGPDCYSWAGGVTDADVAIQGNILTGPEVVEAMKASWDTTFEEPSLARRLLEALQAGDRAGGDSRGRQSAAIFVAREGAGILGGDDVAVDLRIDDHDDPCRELERLLGLHELYLTASRDDEKVPITDELRTELDDRARSLGAADFTAWFAAANYEMRVGDDWVDQRVLGILRRETDPTGTGDGTGSGDARERG